MVSLPNRVGTRKVHRGAFPLIALLMLSLLLVMEYNTLAQSPSFTFGGGTGSETVADQANRPTSATTPELGTTSIATQVQIVETNPQVVPTSMVLPHESGNPEYPYEVGSLPPALAQTRLLYKVSTKADGTQWIWIQHTNLGKEPITEYYAVNVMLLDEQGNVVQPLGGIGLRPLGPGKTQDRPTGMTLRDEETPPQLLGLYVTTIR